MTNTEIVLSIVASLLGSTGLSTVIVACLNRRWSKKDKHDTRIDALVNAQKVTMIDRVRWLGSTYINHGSISLEDKENIHDFYDAYKALGGNGHLETVIHEVDRLPVVGNIHD